MRRLSRDASVIQIRVRYSETDQMGTFYNSRALEWFECGRTEAARQLGIPYAEMEARGLMLPLTEARVFYHGRARYDDLLEVETKIGMTGKARIRFDVDIRHVGGERVASGYTVHAVTDSGGRPMRPPDWFTNALSGDMK